MSDANFLDDTLHASASLQDCTHPRTYLWKAGTLTFKNKNFGQAFFKKFLLRIELLKVLLVVEVKTTAVRHSDNLGICRQSSAVQRAASHHERYTGFIWHLSDNRLKYNFTYFGMRGSFTESWAITKMYEVLVSRSFFLLPYTPAILMQAVAGKRPSRPFRPPRQGDSKKARLPLLWNGSSHGLLSPSIETHLKQSMAHPADERSCALHHES